MYTMSQNTHLMKSSLIEWDNMGIEEKIGYYFNEKNLLNRALTRKAYAIEQKQDGKDFKDQEIFRTLGDAVLKTVLVDLLIKSGCDSRDEITLKKKQLERRESLAKIARELGIGAFIKLGVGEKKQKIDEEPKVLAETLEALVGAIYLDGGFDVSKETISKWFESIIS